jgi:hypothetical protein
MNQFNFLTLKQVVDEEISRNSYVPNSLRFQDRNGVVESSKMMIDSSRYSGRLNNSSLSHRKL